MHLLLVNRWYPPYTGWGGVAAYNYYLAHALKRQGHQVTVLAARWSKADPALQDDDGIQVHRILAEHHARLHRLPILGRFMRPFFQWLYSRKVRDEIINLEKQERFDLVEFAEVNAEGYAYLKRKTRLTVVVRCHTPTFVLRQYSAQSEMPYDTELTAGMEKFCISAADGLTAPSVDMASVIEHSCSLSPKSIVVIPNPLDLALFPVSLHPTSKEEIIILHVGRLDRVKGIEVLIESAAKVFPQYPNARFVMLGGGTVEYLEKLLQLMKSVGVNEAQIQFLGETSQSDLLAWYRRADLAVVPTLNYESFSYTVAQAMASGLPVIASRIGGIPETVGGKDAAILVEPGNVEELAIALRTLCQNTKTWRAMGEAGRLQAETYLSTDVVVQKMLDFYRSILN